MYIKHGKRLTNAQKVYLHDLGLDPADWLVVKNTSELLEIVHRTTSKSRVILKVKGGEKKND